MKKVLVVDDENELASMLVLRLAAAGVAAEAVHDGKAGLERAYASEPDVIVTDVSMPKMDGWSLCEALRKDPRTRRAKLIVITAWNAPGLADRARRLGAELIFKPFDERRFARMVAR